MSPSLLTSPYLYLPAALAAIAALYLLHLALLRDRSHARNPKPRCPRCWYDLSGLSVPPSPLGEVASLRAGEGGLGAAPNVKPLCTCPECGRKITTPRDLHRTRRRPILALLALLLLAPLPTLFILRGDARRTYYALPPKWTTIETLHAGETIATLQHLRNPDDRGCRATITSRGKAFLTVEDYDVIFGYQDLSTDPPTIRGCNQDLNGDGIREFILSAYSGGAHCCYTIYVVELSDPPVIAATIDGQNGIGLRPESTGANTEETLFDISDQSFDYWYAPHAASPFASVYYRLKHHRLEIALDRMAKPPPDELRIDGATTMDIRRSWTNEPFGREPEIWEGVLRLIYSGNQQQAWDFFDAAWPPSRPGKEAFKQEFLEILNKSPQYRDFKAALEAQAKGEPIPPALVGQYHPQSPADPPTATPNP